MNLVNAKNLHILYSLLLSGCIDLPMTGDEGSGSLTTEGGSQQAATSTTKDGVIVAELTASNSETQIVDMENQSGLSGELQIRPGTLAIPTKIFIEEGASLAESVANSSAGAGNTQALGKAVVIKPSVTVNPQKPLIMSLPLASSALATANESSDASLVVAYKGIDYSDNQKVVLGIIPRKNLDIQSGEVTFEAEFFGSYQLLETANIITSITKLNTSDPVQTKVEEKAGPTTTPAMICSGQAAFSESGEKITGTAVCASACSTEGESDCRVESEFIAIRASSLDASKIQSGTLIAGVTGTYAGSFSNCTSNTEVGCITTATFQAADLTNLSPANVRSGIAIAGVTGAYPSASFRLAADTATADLDAATFSAKIKSATGFEWFDSSGARQVGAGDVDIDGPNIRIGYDVFGTSGTFDGVPPDPWDIRINSVVNGVSGKLKVNCRNRVNSTLYNYDGAIGSLPTGSTLAGTIVDIWDTIDDFNNNTAGPPPLVVPGWEDNDCSGVEVAAGDDLVWKDISATGDCVGSSPDCTMMDKITGLHWSKLQHTGQNWSTAQNTCSLLTHNGNSDWRVPTQKELVDAAVHGARSAVSNGWINDTSIGSSYFWSATSNSMNTTQASYVKLARAEVGFSGKGISAAVVCVRP